MLEKYLKGSEWRKWDLHFHTPKSYDYKDNSVTAADIISNLKKSEISVVAITDHHHIDIELIADLQSKGKIEGITVLPGIEFLSDSKGSEPVHFIGIFSEAANLPHIWGQLQHLTPIHNIQGSGKKHNEIYCNLLETISLIKKLGGIVSIHAGNKSNSVENITNSLPHGIAQKTDIASQVDIYELGKVSDQLGYKTIVFPAIKKILPMIICSDNHNSNNYLLKENCWIKADPTFEGLKQIIYEPELRVSIQANLPEDKAGYLIIDRIVLNNPNIENKEIFINSNLNCIIGGRSTGKSILLASLAKKLKTDKPVKFEHNPKYDDFVQSVSDSLTIFWKDGQEQDEREIEYFEQGYMFSLARDNDKLSKLIQDILKLKGKEQALDKYYKNTTEIKKRTSALIEDTFQIAQEIIEKKQKASDKGDVQGINGELSKLTKAVQSVQNVSANESETNIYRTLRNELDRLLQDRAQSEFDISSINGLSHLRPFKETITYETSSLSEKLRTNVANIYQRLINDFNLNWNQNLSNEIHLLQNNIMRINAEINAIENNPIFLKVTKYTTESNQLSEYAAKIQIEKEKLYELTKISDEIQILENQMVKSVAEIKSLNRQHKSNIDQLIPDLSDHADGLKILAIADIRIDIYREILLSALNQRSGENQQFIVKANDLNLDLEDQMDDLFDQLLLDKVNLKGGYSNQALAIRLMTENFYKISYDLDYEGDDFSKMSDGKKAFVVLKLLLDFSDKGCPILIDQPEDDLDNRAIYSDLVSYLRTKKSSRQIIVATHNPNIVVGADSELVIVANQHGAKSTNINGTKFQYVAGSLENTFINSTVNDILSSKGIREHVCEILEGGNTAFRKRDKQYGLIK
jgi:predicted ATPase